MRVGGRGCWRCGASVLPSVRCGRCGRSCVESLVFPSGADFSSIVSIAGEAAVVSAGAAEADDSNSLSGLMYPLEKAYAESTGRIHCPIRVREEPPPSTGVVDCGRVSAAVVADTGLSENLR